MSDADGEIIRSERRGRGQLSRRRGERETGKDENEDEDEDAERMMLKSDLARARRDRRSRADEGAPGTLVVALGERDADLVGAHRPRALVGTNRGVKTAQVAHHLVVNFDDELRGFE